MSEGKRYGGEGQAPIEATKNVLTAGINLLTDRGVGNTARSARACEKHPITVLFESPEDLVEFITDIYGSRAYQLTKEGPASSRSRATAMSANTWRSGRHHRAASEVCEARDRPENLRRTPVF